MTTNDYFDQEMRVMTPDKVLQPRAFALCRGTAGRLYIFRTAAPSLLHDLHDLHGFYGLYGLNVLHGLHDLHGFYTLHGLNVLHDLHGLHDSPERRHPANHAQPKNHANHAFHSFRLKRGAFATR